MEDAPRLQLVQRQGQRLNEPALQIVFADLVPTLLDRPDHGVPCGSAHDDDGPARAVGSPVDHAIVVEAQQARGFEAAQRAEDVPSRRQAGLADEPDEFPLAAQVRRRKGGGRNAAELVQRPVRVQFEAVVQCDGAAVRIARGRRGVGPAVDGCDRRVGDTVVAV